jgi:hypothetical protein
MTCDQNRTSGKWMRFDDRTVTPFDWARLGDECFGGWRLVTEPSRYWWGQPTTKEVDVDSNAFLLVYERVATGREGFEAREVEGMERWTEEVMASSVSRARRAALFDTRLVGMVCAVAHARAEASDPAATNITLGALQLFWDGACACACACVVQIDRIDLLTCSFDSGCSFSRQVSLA